MATEVLADLLDCLGGDPSGQCDEDKINMCLLLKRDYGAGRIISDRDREDVAY